jgi:putative FmdB family regulatory protein
MPIYEYECRKCQARTEVMQKVNDKPLTKCRSCGGRLDKQFSAPAIQFKGSGWYVTDYAGKKAEDKKTDEGGEKKSAPEAATTGDKATPAEAASSKKSSKSKPAPSGGD